MKRFLLFIAVLGLSVPCLAGQVAAAMSEDEDFSSPPALFELQMVPKLNMVVDDASGMPIDIRLDAMREAALSYGARGGLAWRTYNIREELKTRSSYLDKVFDFRQLLIPAPSGLLIEPPIVSEQTNAMIIDTGGQEAAVADRVYNISRNANIVSAARDWRNYLWREWGEVTPPPDILRPNDDYERAFWMDWVLEGWEQGVDQANEIFQQDLDQLTAHYQGMVRYRMLLAQGMVSPPYALQIDRGVTGGGSKMRVGDRAVEITGVPEFIPGTEKWQPANR
ncbi:MAG: type IV secretory system conjugative DNA transfer family protein [Rhodospirillales bacterium]|nr:type IV secretory system conjugative DNA transfer family protein [Rhodospirillales bacterium]MCB9996973.1 type IV secretory system conjugative DNA transfer family protein [Rhodospirillales bacterium]